MAFLLENDCEIDCSSADCALNYYIIQSHHDYCLHDVLDTYFVFLRTRVLSGELSLENENTIVEETRTWLEEKVDETPALQVYLDNFGVWTA